VTEPAGFFDRMDDSDDATFYAPDRLVTHIDEAAIAAVGDLYAELRIEGRVLDLMGSWVSHFVEPPDHLTVLGMNPQELNANPMAMELVRHDLNANPTLPFADATFDDAVCCVSVDYLTRPVEVFAEVARVLRPGGRFVVTWSNRCFPTKAIRGWLMADHDDRRHIVRSYFDRSERFGDVVTDRRVEPSRFGDPLDAAWAARTDADPRSTAS
jgi:SAM-dependent methyltransferase